MARKTSAKPLKTAHRFPKAPTDSAGKDRALAALLDSPTIVAAAQAAGVGESTLRRWLHDDEEFQDKLRQSRQQALRHVSLRLQQRASEAVEALFDNIASEKRVEPGRAAMLRTALDFAFRAGAYNDLAERLEALETAAKQEHSNTTKSESNATSRNPEDQVINSSEEAINGHQNRFQ